MGARSAFHDSFERHSMRFAPSARWLLALTAIAAVNLSLAAPQAAAPAFSSPVQPLAAGPTPVPGPVAIAMQFNGSGQGLMKGNSPLGPAGSIQVLGIEHVRSVVKSGTSLGLEPQPALELIKPADAASLDLYEAMFLGELCKADILWLGEPSGPGGANPVFFEMHLDQVRIESISQSHAVGQPAQEVVKLRYRTNTLVDKLDGDSFKLPEN